MINGGFRINEAIILKRADISCDNRLCLSKLWSPIKVMNRLKWINIQRNSTTPVQHCATRIFTGSRFE